VKKGQKVRKFRGSRGEGRDRYAYGVLANDADGDFAVVIWETKIHGTPRGMSDPVFPRLSVENLKNLKLCGRG